MKATICAHFIDEDNGLYCKQYVANVPRVGDEVRFGGAGNEVYCEVTRVVWVYDEPENPYERANIGTKPIVEDCE